LAPTPQQALIDTLEYLRSKDNNSEVRPALIFPDINMPGMNGWEFPEEHKGLDGRLQSKAIIVMLTTSQNPDDETEAMSWNVVSAFRTKPLTKEILEEVIKS
jgi:CheY-like chemotaxis protein